MGLGRYVVDAVVREGHSPTELARSHGLSRTWIYELVKRFRQGGYDALEPRSRRPILRPGRVRSVSQTSPLRPRSAPTAHQRSHRLNATEAGAAIDAASWSGAASTFAMLRLCSGS